MHQKSWGRRGRPPKNRHSYKNSRILEYLAKIAVKYNSSDLWGDIRKAWNHGEANCQKLSIWCRERKKESAMFLFTTGPNVVAQFSIPTTLLQGKVQLEPYMKQIRSSLARDSRVLNPRIKDLKAGMKKIDLKATVLEIPKPNMFWTRAGFQVQISNVFIGDETGTMRMSLFNQQIHLVAKGDRITVENGSVASFRGELQLRIGRRGSLSVIPPAS
jgi:replication factor A1